MRYNNLKTDNLIKVRDMSALQISSIFIDCYDTDITIKSLGELI